MENPMSVRCSKGFCLGCGTPLDCRDDDLNGEGNVTCARCRAEENHDFDAEPGVVYNRDGSRKGKS